MYGGLFNVSELMQCNAVTRVPIAVEKEAPRLVNGVSKKKCLYIPILAYKPSNMCSNMGN